MQVGRDLLGPLASSLTDLDLSELELMHPDLEVVSDGGHMCGMCRVTRVMLADLSDMETPLNSLSCHASYIHMECHGILVSDSRLEPVPDR
jgi:hypothetical protein